MPTTGSATHSSGTSLDALTQSTSPNVMSWRSDWVRAPTLSRSSVVAPGGLESISLQSRWRGLERAYAFESCPYERVARASVLDLPFPDQALTWSSVTAFFIMSQI